MCTVARSISDQLLTCMTTYSEIYDYLPASWVTAVFLLATIGIIGAVFFYTVSPGANVMVSLRLCSIRSDQIERIECAFSVVRSELVRKGVTSGMNAFVMANKMYQNRLDVDCHAAVHRVGDMAYYDLFKNDPEFSHYEFPRETTMCGRGFYHGFFEHLIQDNPRPEFIVHTCNYFKSVEQEYLQKVSSTCFHAAGHGLIRATAEKVPRSSWGNPTSFVDPSLRSCELMIGVTESEKRLCQTGVMSIFIQMNRYENYGFSKKTAFETCDSLVTSQRETCYRMSSLMVAQFEGDYKRTWSICNRAAPALQRACIIYIPIGLFTNGVNPISYQTALDFCSAVAATNAQYASLCYEHLGYTLTSEYVEPSYRPDCVLFPTQYRDFCISPDPDFSTTR